MKKNQLAEVKTLEKSLYGLSGLGISIFFGMPMIYLVIYYTDVFGISAAAVGTLLLVARVWDAINDPIMGTIIDRTRTKWGKCRPYMIFGSVLLFISFVLVFSGPTSFSGTAKLVYAYITYILFGMMYTMVDIPANAIISTMTRDTSLRTSISTTRRVFCNVGILIGAAAVIPLVGIFGKGDSAKGYIVTALVLGFIGSVTIILSGVTAKERITPKEHSKYGIKDMLNILKVNKPLMIISTVFMVNQLATTIKSAATAFYFSYNVGRPDLIPIVSGIALIATIIGTMCIPMLTKRYGKKKSVVIALYGIALSSTALVFIPFDNIALIVVQFIVNSFVSGFGLALPFIMVIDTVEYGEWKTGVRSEGLVFSTLSFGTKLGTALGGAILGYVLHFTGYIPNAVQSPAALKGIILCMAGIPAFVAGNATLLMKFYDLDEKMYDQVISDLKKCD